MQESAVPIPMGNQMNSLKCKEKEDKTTKTAPRRAEVKSIVKYVYEGIWS
jgi:hypothetical protein